MNAQLAQEIQDTIKKALEIFTEKYTKDYFLSLVKIIQEDAEKDPGPDYELLERPKEGRPHLKEGWILRESSILKKWKKKYVVVRPDYNVDYFGSEEAAKKGKGRNTINLVGYSVVDDPNQGILLRLKKLAEKMGMDLSGLPKPKEYPPFTVELYHPRRPVMYFKADNEDEFKGWVSQFRTAAWNATSLTWDDEAHRRAFPKAIRKTRWAMDRWYWWSSQGTEEQILGDLIAEELEWEIMGKLLSGLPGPYFVKSKIRAMAMKTIDTMIITAVKPAWVALKKTVEEIRAKIEPTLRESLQPIFKAKKDIVDKMKDQIMRVIEPVLEEHVNPHLAKIVGIIKSPMVDAYAETLRLFEEHLGKLPEGGAEEVKKKFWDLDYFARSWWSLRSALNMIDPMYEPLWALHEVFKDIYPWHLVYKGHDKIYHIADQAVYTFEKGIEDGAADRAALTNEVFSKYRHDSKIHAKNYYAHILKTILLPPFEAIVVPAGKPIIDPLANMVPEPLQQFIDINEMYEDLYNGVLDDSIQVVLRADERS